MKDVARRAGVSLGTVSNVINGTKVVRASTKEAVEAAISELGFRPNPLARSLIARRGQLAPVTVEENRPRLVCVGSVSVDYTAQVDALPGRDDRLTAVRIEKSLGGPATNVAVHAAGLGAPLDLRVELVTELGDDADSDWVLEELTALHVDASGAVRQAGSRLARCIVLVDECGERAIVNESLTVTGAHLLDYLSQEHSPAEKTCIHLDGYQLAPAWDAMDAIRESRAISSMHTTGLPPDWRTVDSLEKLLEAFDIVFLNRDVAPAMSRIKRRAGTTCLVNAVDKIIQASAREGGLTLLTLGAEGAVLLRKGAPPVRAKAPRTTVVDTTGAGDAFVGIFLASWLCDGDGAESAERALERAVLGASQTVRAIGAQGIRLAAADLSPPKRSAQPAPPQRPKRIRRQKRGPQIKALAK